MSILEELKQALSEIDEDRCESLLTNAIGKHDVQDIIETALAPGIRQVGDLFEEGDYFLPELMLGAEIMKSAMDRLAPMLEEEEKTSRKVGVVIGTVKGDIHDIGKTLVASMLTAAGYEVHDLGSDTPTDKFIHALKKTSSHFLCLSALLTTTMKVQKEVIDRIKKEGLDVRVLVGGAPIDQAYASAIGADGYASNAAEAVKLIDGMVTT